MVEELLKSAMAGVASTYIRLPEADTPTGKHRERVYCYELYHQMRMLQTRPEFKRRFDRFQVAGEADKSSNRDATISGLGKTKPDFIFHIPGSRTDNFLVSEVKSVGASWQAIANDLEKLAKFTNGKLNYRRGAFILFGDGIVRDSTVVRRVKLAFQRVSTIHDVSHLTFYWHKNAAPTVLQYCRQRCSFTTLSNLTLIH